MGDDTPFPTDDLDRMKTKMRLLSGKKYEAKLRAPDTSAKTVLSKRERSKHARRSKNKGSSYERKIAKKFATWSGETIKRTPQSGGWGGGAEFGVTGDIACPNKAFPFHVEAKKREGWLIEDLVTGVRRKHSQSITEWWDQCTTQCPKGKIALLVFSRNLMPDLCMMSLKDAQKLFSFDFTLEFISSLIGSIEGTKRGDGEVVVMALDVLLAKLRPAKGLKARKKWKAPTALPLVEEDE